MSDDNWLGLKSPWPHPVCRQGIPREPAGAVLGPLVSPFGDGVEREPTEVRLWSDDQALHLQAVCRTAALDRLRALAARPTPYARDAWGDDALEVQIDVGRTRETYRHFILPPNEKPITFIGSNNLQVQGWHPVFSYRVKIMETGWMLEAAFPFSILERIPQKGEIWGFNLLRVNPAEPHHYVQWSPTFGEALRAELFGEIEFAGPPGHRATEIAAYAQTAARRQTFFLTTINAIDSEEALRELGRPDWADWGRHLAERPGPVALRWDDVEPSPAGIPDRDRHWLLDLAATQVTQIAEWTMDPPDPRSFGIEPLEALGDAYAMTGDSRYRDAFERALAIHTRRVRDIRAGVRDPRQLPYSTNPYHDSQIIRAEMLAYVYIVLRHAGLAPETHAHVMGLILRSCRFAAFNIGLDYTYGNHQVYESGGLAAVAALFPEFPESAAWAQIASRSIRLHLERELYPDGAYRERCGYHTVALSYVMHAVATIRLNRLEDRFPELMSAATLGRLERMYDWLLQMTAPDGTLPAFGDCGASSMLRFLRRGAAIFDRPDLAWPLHQLAPALVPAGLRPLPPSTPLSVSLPSDFTVLRDGWSPTSFYMAIDHGPLGGQHSHIDTVGFVAYAHGRPLALDSGLGPNYEDPRYIDWFRKLRAHNVVAIDDLESEKVARRIFWKPGPDLDVVGCLSLAYTHALGVTHTRTFYFAKGVGWLIDDQLVGPEHFDWSQHTVDWIFHTPYALSNGPAGVLQGLDEDGGLLVLPGFPETLESPQLEAFPAAHPCPQAREMRLWDVGRRISQAILTPAITSLTWRRKPTAPGPCRFVTGLLPYRGKCPEARLTPTPAGFRLQRTGLPDIVFPNPQSYSTA